MSAEPVSFMDRMKKMGKTMVDSGAKTMLKTDVVFLDREVKNRKMAFGVEVYDLMESLEQDTGMPTEEKEAKIRLAFDTARKDIAVIQAKIECKKEEMNVLDTEAASASQVAASDAIPPSSGAVLTDDNMDDAFSG